MQACIVENQFFSSAVPVNLITYLSDGVNEMALQLPCIFQREQENLTKFTLNIMYRLRNNHPVINGVGIFSTEATDECYLVFVQVSISKYSTHDPRLNSLFTNNRDTRGCKELKTSFLKLLSTSNEPEAGIDFDSSIESSTVSLPLSSDSSTSPVTLTPSDAGTSTALLDNVTSIESIHSYFDYYQRLAINAGHNLDRNHIVYLYASNRDLEKNEIKKMKEDAGGRCSVGKLQNYDVIFK